MTVGLLGTAASGLQAFQRAIGVTGHNIANANTEGYTRQRVEFGTRVPSFTGQGYIGNGVQIQSVDRQYDQFLTENVRSTTSSSNQYDTFSQYSERVANLLGDADAGLSAGLDGFFNSVQGVADEPASVPARQVMLGEAESLVGRYHNLNNQLDDMRTEVNGGLRNMVSEINSLSTSIAEANKLIVDARSMSGGEQPNDLMDQRDVMIARLSELVEVRTVEQDDGSINVFIGSGQPLVTRFLPSTLETVPNGFDSRRIEVALSNGGISSVVSDSITGGKMGAMLDFRDQVLDPSQNALGRLAVTVASEFNNQHQAGMDLDGDMGKGFFSIGAPLASGDKNNNGTASVAVSYDAADLSNLTTSDYVMKYDGAAWQLQRTDNGQLVPMSGSGTTADPYSADSLNIVVNGAAVAGDRFQIQPTRNGSSSLQLRVNNTREIAAASPVSIGEAVNANGLPTNAGSADMSLESIEDGFSSPGSGITLTYDATLQQFNYTGAASGSFAYDPAVDSGTEYTVAGIRFSVASTPSDGDSFIIQPAGSGSGDNHNALALAGLQSEQTMEGGTASFKNSYGQLIGDVGTQTRNAQITAEAQQALQRQAEETRNSKSGVNLDQEAADMLRYQQAYQALARVIAVADETFQSLLNAVGR